MSPQKKVITGAMVKELRELTSAGMHDCKKALELRDGIFEYAIEYLQRHNLAVVIKPLDREEEFRFPKWHAYQQSLKNQKD